MRGAKALLFSAALLAGLGIVELAARAYVTRRDAGVLNRAPVLALYAGIENPQEIFSSLMPADLAWSPYAHWVTKPNLQKRFYSTNALGFRGRETTLEKPAGRYRVVVIGGSSAWGSGVLRMKQQCRAGWKRCCGTNIPAATSR